MKQNAISAARISLTGNRKNNQDRSLVLSHQGTTLIALADGLGGHPRGEVAAQLFTDICESLFRQATKPLPDPDRFMQHCIQKAHQAIVRFGNRQTPPIYPRTTAVIAVLQGNMAYWVHVGDSRLYLVRNAKILAQTRDHSRVHYIRPSTSAGSKARASITRCLGGPDQPPAVSVATATALQSDDALMLCSDGLWGQVPRKQLVTALSCNADFIEAINELAEDAVHQGYPHSDNVTAIAVKWLPEQETPTDSRPLIEETGNRTDGSTDAPDKVQDHSPS